MQTRTPIENALDALLEEERRAGIVAGRDKLVVMTTRGRGAVRWPRSSVVVV
ncbi:MAG TPA: hypothetical protein VJY65_13490 [Chloroflexota bacterium]|nr:hypothetical protein [Chloroflexota bacterium]